MREITRDSLSAHQWEFVKSYVEMNWTLVQYGPLRDRETPYTRLPGLEFIEKIMDRHQWGHPIQGIMAFEDPVVAAIYRLRFLRG